MYALTILSLLMAFMSFIAVFAVWYEYEQLNTKYMRNKRHLKLAVSVLRKRSKEVNNITRSKI